MKRELLAFLLLATLSVFGAEKELAAARLFYSATVNKTAIAIYIGDRPFDPSRHQTTPLRNTGTEQNPTWKAATIDGRVVVGTDQTLPEVGRPQLSQLYVQFGDKRIDVPERLLTHVFSPHLDRTIFDHRFAHNVVSISSDGRAVIISLGVGDGGAAASYSIYVGSDGTCTNEEPRRPEP